MAATLGLLLTAAVTTAAMGAVATGDTSKDKIALSNSFAGNTFRQQQLKSWAQVALQAKQAGLIGDAPAFTTAENQATEQAQQIQNLVLQGYKAIVINAASPTALNGSVKRACNAGVIVVSFDGVVTEPCAYRIAADFPRMGAVQVDFLAKKLNGKGNILEIRGLAGVSVDDEIHRGVVDEMKKYPGMKLVGSVYGAWTQTVAQKEVAGVLPSLPQVDGVVTQGGDGYGVAQAFRSAGRTVPTIILGNRQEELAWWKSQGADNYKTMSIAADPGSSTFAFWVAQQLLAGNKLPHDMSLPTLTVMADGLDAVLAHTAPGTVASNIFTREQVVGTVERQKKP
ncbi:ABC transporter substrate-binding protein [Robbsia sp. Bb-Pol-6]|uniref:ABC transporter substrate-binding protein n=1 Tax=Robbsia betulipollinis TaxID=2981849 RepID=A0ABT3ZSQ3_9BURK|nr:ABC transporter substrate-binding protein [Robbsia betulipollinis]MCY0389575.1 ABC transporter substrate-binding protein [Robbsia betulipollinis]